MKSSDKNTKIIRLTRIKSWYLPVDIESYKVLRDLQVPLIRIPESFLPTLKLVTGPNNVRAKLVDFNSGILHPYLDNIGEKWNANEYRKATITNSLVKLETTHASIFEKSKENLVKISASLRKFFARWGYTCAIEISESRGKCKLYCTYKYKGELMPVMPLAEDVTSMPVVRLKLGFTRISLTFLKREIEVNVSISTGGKWASINTSRCLYSQFGNVMPMISALANVINHDQYNVENSND